MAVEEKWKSTIKCCYHVCPGVYCYIFEKGGDRIVSLGVMGGGSHRTHVFCCFMSVGVSNKVVINPFIL